MNRSYLIAGALLGIAFVVFIGVVIVIGLAPSEAPAESGNIATPAPAVPTPPVPFDPIRLAWFYRPPEGLGLDELAARFDFFILTNNDEDELRALKESGVGAPVLQYLRMDAIHDPGDCSRQPLRNQAANQVGDICRIREEHPDWFLRDVDGNPVTDDDFVLMDPASPGWRDFWLERARVAQEYLGWDGVFLDNAEASLSKRERRGKLLAAYPDDASYQAAVAGFIEYVYTTYFQPSGRPLMANIIALREPTAWFDYLQVLDGAMKEAFAVDWDNGYLSASDWEQHLAIAEQTQQAGKTIVLVGQGEAGDADRQLFALASFLLVSDGGAYFRYADSSAYRYAWLYENYDLDLGQPLGARYQDGEVWARDFQRGSVRVDPTTHTAEITTP